MNLLSIAFERKIFVRALFVAIVVGVVLNLINQGYEIVHFEFNKINYTKFFLTFIVPYLVSTYSSVMAKLNFSYGEFSPVDAYLECSCGDIINVKKGELIPECEDCGEETKYKLSKNNTRDLKRFEEQLKLMAMFAELNPAPVFRFNKEGIISESNPASNHIFKHKSITGKNIAEILPGVKKINIVDTISNGKILNLIESIDNQTYRFELRGVPELNSCQIYGADISEITKTKIENLKFTKAIEQTSNSIMITNPRGNIEFVNTAFEEITGYVQDEVLGKNPRILKTDHLPKEVYIEMWETLKSGNVWKGEFHNRKKDGSKYWEEATISPIRNEAGEIISYMAVKEDITENKKAKKALQSMAMFAKLNPEPVFRFNADGIIMESNPAANASFEKITLVGYYVHELLPSTEEIDIKEFIKNSQINIIEENVDEKIYRFILRGIPNLNVVQIYGSDITQRRLAEQKVLMQKESIESSIKYAKRIQNAVLPSREKINSTLHDHFIMFKPRDIVSGDFYWINEVDNKIYIVAADCTGHGVPGAFMSMLGISLLNEIINKGQCKLASEVLNELRKSVKTTLSQTGKDREAKDGMDMAICIVDKDSLNMHYAGAYNPLYLVRDNELITYKADRMPIGIYVKEKDSFTNHEIQLQKNDRFYIFSDGYSDQFGGEKGNKLSTKKLKEKIMDLQSLSMIEQKEALEKYYDNWKGDLEQVDDVVFIGVSM
jgi:PAS domain S-box-containing protein